MKSFDTELEKFAKKVHLKASERAALRARILSYMEYHPLPKSTHAIKETSTLSRFASTFSILHTTYARVAMGALMLFMVVGIPLAAEHSLPGNVLYPIKTKFNEGIRAQFVNSPYKKVAFETELMERRIAEARLLAKEGKLTEAVEAAIAETVKSHASAAQEGIAALKAHDQDEGVIAEITFSSALDVQSAVLDSTNGTTTASSTDGIAGALNDARAASDAQKATTTPSYERLMARVESETSRAYELLAAVETSATPTERTDIERRLADIGAKIKAAKEAHDEENAVAGTMLTETLADIQKLITFMTDIDVRANVELETLVPIVLTPEERLEAAGEAFTSLKASSTDLSLRAEGNSNTKIQTTFEALAAALSAIETALADKNIMEVEAEVTNAKVFMLDINTALAGESASSTPLNK